MRKNLYSSRTPEQNPSDTKAAGFQLKRRHLLQGSAVLATAAGIAACGEEVNKKVTTGGSGKPSPEQLELSDLVTKTLQDLPDVGANVPNLAKADMSQTPEPLQVSFPTLPAAYNFAVAMDICANKSIREHSYVPEDKRKDLKITGKMIASAPTVLAALMEVAYGDEPAGAISVWYDASKDRPYLSTGLIAADKWGTFCEQVLSEAKNVEDADTSTLETMLQEQPRPYGNGPTLVFAQNGDLNVIFPVAKVKDEYSPVQITLTAANSEALLSEFGKAARSATTNPQNFELDKLARPAKTNTHHGDSQYQEPETTYKAEKPREADAPGPVAQLAPRAGKGVRPAVVVGPDCTRLKAVSLTFDDGPDPNLNHELLKMLYAEKAACSFYNIGKNAQAYPKASAATAHAGQEVGCHSWSHPPLTKTRDLKHQLHDTAVEVAKLRGSWPLVMRPPYGDHNSRVDAEIAKLNQSIQLWDVDTNDWKFKNVAHNFQVVEKESHRGAIILMHEIHATSVESVPQILKWFTEHGYTTVTNSEVGENQMYPGYWYTRGLVTKEGTEKADAPAPTPSPSAGSDGKSGDEKPAGETKESDKPANNG